MGGEGGQGLVPALEVCPMNGKQADEAVRNHKKSKGVSVNVMPVRNIMSSRELYDPWNLTVEMVDFSGVTHGLTNGI